jgi:site-specific DNA-cytosine methylase
MRMLDICSGLGGASEAFIDAGWEVTRLENNPLLTNESKIPDGLL